MAFKDDSAAAETARFCAEDIEDILLKRAERRQVGSRKGNTFSTATFVAEDEPPPGAAAGGSGAGGEAGEAAPGAGMTGAEFWAVALPDAAAMAAAGPRIDHRFAVEGPRQRKKARFPARSRACLPRSLACQALLPDTPNQNARAFLFFLLQVNYNLKMMEGTLADEAGAAYDRGDDSDFSAGGGDDSDSGGGMPGTWTNTQVQQLEQWVISFGVGRLPAAVAKFRICAQEISDTEALEVANALVRMVEVAAQHEGQKEPPAPAPAAPAPASGRSAAKAAAEDEEDAALSGGAAEKVDEELHELLSSMPKPECAARALSSRRVTARLGRNALSYMQLLSEREMLRNLLEDHARTDEQGGEKDYAECSAFPIKSCGRSLPPAPWWGPQQDRDLLRGSMRWGFLPPHADLCRTQLVNIRQDVLLSFKDKLKELAAAKAAEQGGAAGGEGDAAGGEGDAAAAAADGGAMDVDAPPLPPVPEDEVAEMEPVEPPPGSPPPAAATSPAADGVEDAAGEGADAPASESTPPGEPSRGGSGELQMLLPGSMRCGHCRSCTNPKLKQACFTRRKAEGGTGGAGLGAARAAPEVGIEFWPAPAAVKRRLMRLVEALMRPEPVKAPPRKRVRAPAKRNSRSRAGERRSGGTPRKRAPREDDGSDDDFQDTPSKRSRLELTPSRRTRSRPEGSNDENVGAQRILKVTLTVPPGRGAMSPLPHGGAGVDAPYEAPLRMRGLAPLPKAGKAKSKVEKHMEREKAKKPGGGVMKQAPLSFTVKPPKPPPPTADEGGD
jgi:hypothetical protein